jgi:hypothetical protein
VNVVSSPNRVIPHPLIERSGNHPTGAHQCLTSRECWKKSLDFYRHPD